VIARIKRPVLLLDGLAAVLLASFRPFGDNSHLHMQKRH